MHVFYHPHARLRMRQRRVTEEQVAEVLSEPSLTRPADRGHWYERTISTGRHLKVVAVKGEVRENEFVVYTVAWKDEE